jgi:phospholipid transport system substrate-binding protein
MNMLRGLALSFVVCVASLVMSGASYAKSTDDAKAYVNNVATQALSIIKTDTGKDAKKKKLEKLFAESVNLSWIGKFVMGRYWRQATDDQKKRYTQEYERFILHHYTSRFTEYTSGSFTITDAKDDGNNEYTVNMSLKDDTKKNEPPVLVDYRVRKEGSGFKIFDVIVEGVSMITTQRSEFASVLAKHDIEHLITQLAKKSVTETVK